MPPLVEHLWGLLGRVVFPPTPVFQLLGFDNLPTSNDASSYVRFCIKHDHEDSRIVMIMAALKRKGDLMGLAKRKGHKMQFGEV